MTKKKIKEEFVNEQTPAPENLILIFKLNGENFGVKGEKIREVLDAYTITSVPRVPSFIQGITNVRGRILTILDLTQLLSLPSFSPDRDSKILFVEDKNVDIGLMVKSLIEVRRLSVDSLKKLQKPAPERKTETKFIEGILQLDEMAINLLSLKELIRFVNEFNFSSSLP